MWLKKQSVCRKSLLCACALKSSSSVHDARDSINPAKAIRAQSLLSLFVQTPPPSPKFSTGTGTGDHLISKNPVVQVLINSSLVLLVEYALFYLLVNVCCQLLRLCKCASSIASNGHLRSTSRSDASRLGRDQLSRDTR